MAHRQAHPVARFDPGIVPLVGLRLGYGDTRFARPSRQSEGNGFSSLLHSGSLGASASQRRFVRHAEASRSCGPFGAASRRYSLLATLPASGCDSVRAHGASVLPNRIGALAWPEHVALRAELLCRLARLPKSPRSPCNRPSCGRRLSRLLAPHRLGTNFRARTRLLYPRVPGSARGTKMACRNRARLPYLQTTTRSRRCFYISDDSAVEDHCRRSRVRCPAVDSRPRLVWFGSISFLDSEAGRVAEPASAL